MEESWLTNSRGGCRWDWGSAHGATNNGRGLAAAGRHAVALRLLGEDFEAVGDGGGFAEHGGYGAVFVLAKFDGVADGFFFQLAGEAVEHFDLGPDGWGVFGAFAGDFDFEGGEFLAFFSEDGDYVYGRASSQGSEEHFHGAGGGVVFAVGVEGD